MNRSVADIEPGWAGADPFDASFKDDPYAVLNPLREQHRVNLTPVGTYRVTRYDDLKSIFKHARTSMTLANGESPNFHPADERGSFRDFLLNLDDPKHIRLRKLVFKSFNNRTVKRFEIEAKDIADNTMQRALAAGGMDLIADLAHLLPSQIVCRIMGVPEADRELFTRWTAARTNAFFARFLPDEIVQSLVDAGNEMADYFDDLVRERRKHLRDDLLSELIRAEEDGDRLLDGEIVVQAIGVIVAGFETTIGLIGNGARALIEHPAQMALLRNQPDLLNNCIEECLRYDTPVLFNWRVLVEPYRVGEVVIPEDAVIWQMLACGNRDPRQFDKPDEFRIDRENVAHQSFGGGSHFCLGNQLAKVEARHALGTFARETRHLAIVPGQPTWSDSFFRVLGSFPVTFN
ncbi:MAG: cytochrome P450 [Halieaceae bacterium]|jgi:cytochrome P450|nr:cytochrome P450 [Halieaceae bacterium]